jgi:RNA polymerase sigma-70 factor, ECF subfamily
MRLCNAQRRTGPLRSNHVTDTELALAAREGDRDAFGELIERHAPAARRVARSILRHPEDADDAAQDGFYSAWRNLDRFDTGRPFGPWLIRIVINAAQDLRRRRAVRSTEPLPAEVAASGRTPARIYERAELGKRVDAALADLPERQRVAVVLFDVEGYSHAEIAELLGIPVGTARSDLFHGRRALRARLDLKGEAE